MTEICRHRYTKRDGEYACKVCGAKRPRVLYEACEEVEALLTARRTGETVIIKRKPYLQSVRPGDRVWVKEAYQPPMFGSAFGKAKYAADHPDLKTWRKAYGMPKKFSRITLEVIKVEGNEVTYSVKEVL